MNTDYVTVFGFLQYFMRHPSCPYNFFANVDFELESAGAAYRIIDNTIIPIGSDAESEPIKRAFSDLAATEFHGARQHLSAAAEQLTEGHSSNSIRESIHAVESVVRVLKPDANFARALTKLDKKVEIHGAMKTGFGNLYGFTNDEKESGIRCLTRRWQTSMKWTPYLRLTRARPLFLI